METLNMVVGWWFRIFIGACKGLVLVRNCSNCTFTLAARQFRSQDVRDCCFFLYCMTDPVIERSSNLEFGPFNGAYPEHADHVQAAGLDLASDKWWRVYDMTSSAAPTGPHFRLITMQEWGNHEGVEPWLPAGEGADPAVPLTWPPQAVWQVEWEDALRAKLEAEQAKERSEKERAQEELDQFYDRRTDLYAHRQARNRELEQLFLDKIESEENEENPFARVLSLIGAGSSSTAGDSGVGADKSRFRSLLFDLRERAPPSLERSALSASSNTTVGSSANATTGRSRGGGAGSLDADESSDGGRRAGGAAQGEEGER